MNPKGTSFYPDVIPPDDAHPTTERFEIADTGDGRGQGLRAKAAIRRGDCAALLSGVLINHTTLATIQISPTLHLCDPWFCRYLLHSCDPNLAIDTSTLEARATRDIAAGEFLSLDYAATDDFVADQFECRCGAPNCRRWITGRREVPNAEGRAFLANLKNR